jgi:hypothetical protein
MIITGHQAFFTHNALEAQETLHNVTLFERGERPSRLIMAEKVLAKRKRGHCLYPLAAYNDGVGRLASHLIATLQQACRTTR